MAAGDPAWGAGIVPSSDTIAEEHLLVTVHAGTGEVGRDEAFGTKITLVATLFSEQEVRAALEGAGFRIDEMVTRPPYDFEYPSRRIYTLATRA